MSAITLPASRKELENVAIRSITRAKNAAAKAKSYAENVMEAGIAVGAAAGMGYWLGRPDAEDQYFGIDVELLVGIPTLGFGIVSGGKMAGSSKAIGVGVLSAWAFNKAHAKAAEG